MRSTAGSYTKDEPNFPWENNLISHKIKVSSIDKVVNFKDFQDFIWGKLIV